MLLFAVFSLLLTTPSASAAAPISCKGNDARLVTTEDELKSSVGQVVVLEGLAYGSAEYPGFQTRIGHFPLKAAWPVEIYDPTKPRPIFVKIRAKLELEKISHKRVVIQTSDPLQEIDGKYEYVLRDVKVIAKKHYLNEEEKEVKLITREEELQPALWKTIVLYGILQGGSKQTQLVTQFGYVFPVAYHEREDRHPVFVKVQAKLDSNQTHWLGAGKFRYYLRDVKIDIIGRGQDIYEEGGKTQFIEPQFVDFSRYVGKTIILNGIPTGSINAGGQFLQTYFGRIQLDKSWSSKIYDPANPRPSFVKIRAKLDISSRNLGTSAIYPVLQNVEVLNVIVPKP
jgi:hypothetical protein